MPESESSPITPKQVAEWMVEQIDEYDELRQTKAAASIQELFGDEFVYFDEHGNLAINRKVLYQFRKMTADFVVWEVTNGNWFDGFWRKRQFRDGPWRKQNG